MLRYYIMMNGGAKRMGPFTLKELEALVLEGSLSLNESVSPEDGGVTTTVYKILPPTAYTNPWDRYRTN